MTHRRVVRRLDNDSGDLAAIDGQATHRHRRKRQDVAIAAPPADRFEWPSIDRQIEQLRSSF